MSLPILQTKLFIPRPRFDLVARTARLTRLGIDDIPPLTLVSAPAGFGKTTLVSEWIQNLRLTNDEWRVAWLSLGEDDNEPIRWLSYLITALQTCQPQLGETALALLTAPQPPPLKNILTLLLNELSTWPEVLLLVLDDYHTISEPAIHDALVFLIDHLPAALRLILTSRVDPPLPLARWRVRKQLLEIRADELRFTHTEVVHFLNEVMHFDLNASEIAQLETRTEGWIAGLQLAALSMQGQADVAGFIQAFSGSHRHVLSYLVEEVLNRQPQDVRTFLLQTSILDHLCASLCDAVTETSVGQATLAQLEQANLFLIPLDNEGKWYRYHHLFSEMLRTRLQQLQPAIIPQLHQRACAWFAATGQIEQAVEQALAIPDVEQAATLVERIALASVVQQSEVRLVHRLVQRLPLAVVYRRPYLTLAYGFTLALSGQLDGVSTLLRYAAPVLNSVDLPDEVAGGLAVLHSTMARFRGDLTQSLALAQQALDRLPVHALALRGGAALNMGAVYLHRGDRVAADLVLADAVTWGSAARADYIVFLAWEELITDQVRQGQLVQAKQRCEGALADVLRWSNPRVPAVGLLQVALGEVLVECNELEQATQVLTQGVQLLLGTTEMGLLARGYGALARGQWASGERVTALATLHQGETWLAQIPTAAPGTYARLAAQRARFQVWQGDLDAALRWDQTNHPQGETLVSYLQQLTRVRIRLAQYHREQRASFLQEATAILVPLLTRAEVNGWGSHVIEILLLQSLLEQAQDNRPSAQHTLARALTLAEPGGYLRIFTDEGEAMRLLILDFGFWIVQQPPTEQNSVLSAYADRLLAAFDRNPSQPAKSMSTPLPQSQNLIEPLSVRELEVLRLAADGYSNTEIAARLIVATSTVKTHINRIFSKLDVQSRTRAVAQARELGLL